MSAILNTLKKLEEEKSVFEQSLDVQDLALHREFGSTAPFVQITQKRNSLIIIASVSIFLIVLAGMYFYFKSNQSQISKDLTPNSFFDSPRQSDLNKVELPKGASVSGISMNQISGDRSINLKGKPVARQSHQVNSTDTENTKVDEVSNQAKVLEVVKLIRSEKELKKSPVQSVPIENVSRLEMERVSNQKQNLEEENIAPTIQNEAKMSEEDIRNTNDEFVSLIEKTRINQIAEEISAKPQRQSLLNIPSLKLKGIIYFSEGNPANYIFISSPGQNNVKLKVGESIVGATLQSIQSSKAIFTKDGETGYIEMGQ